MASTATRERGAGTIVRNTKGEPVAVRANTANGGKGTIFYRPSHTPVTEAEALERAPELAALIRRSVSASDGLTVAEWWKLYLDAAAAGKVGKKSRGRPQMTVPERRARFANHIEPFIGAKPMATIKSDELRPIVTALDEHMRTRGRFYAGEIGRTEKRNTKPGLSAKTAANLWGEVTSAFGEACSSKLDELRVRDDDPTKRVQGPNHGDDREQAALYPNEIRALLEHPDVPLYRKRLYALAAYTGLRVSELRGLRVHDVDDEHAMIVVRRQQRDANEATTTRKKTRAAKRSVPIMPVLAPLLEVLIKDAVDGALVKVPPTEDCAELVRKDLLTAGVTREELHADDDERQHFTFHGLRHTCITHWAVAGFPMQWIQAAAGHTDWQTTQGYLDAALLLRGSFGEPHAPIPVGVQGCPTPSGKSRTEVGRTDRKHANPSGKLATPSGIEPELPA
jgi:integrase